MHRLWQLEEEELAAEVDRDVARASQQTTKCNADNTVEDLGACLLLWNRPPLFER
jgi:hypothetical protein